MDKILNKPCTATSYYELFQYAVDNGLFIEDKGTYYALITTPSPSLKAWQHYRIMELKNMRDTLETKPILYQGYLFDYDSKARERINAAIIALENAGTGASLTWTTADDKDVKVTASDLRGVITQVALRSDKLHTAYREAKAEVEAAPTKEAIDAITLEVE